MTERAKEEIEEGTGQPDTPAYSWDNLRIHDGTVEAIKWLAVIFMTIDHINTHLISLAAGGAIPELFYIGRLAFPLFALVIAYNLARKRSASDERKAIIGALKRLTLFGVFALAPDYILNGGEPAPLNIMFTLAVAVAVIYFLRIGKESERKDVRYPLYFCGLVVFILFSLFVDYSAYGVSLVIMAWLFFRYSSAIALLMMITIIIGLKEVNASTFYAVLAIPIFILGYFIEVKIPRTNKYTFYAYYPLHLAFIAITALIYNAYY